MATFTVYLVTHGETEVFSLGRPIADPGMTHRGHKQMIGLGTSLGLYLPPHGPPEVHCGTGCRHRETYIGICNLWLKAPLYFSPLWGEAARRYLDEDDGKYKVILGSGLIISPEEYLGPKHLAAAMPQVVTGLPDKSLICSGTAALKLLGVPQEIWFDAAVYGFTFSPNEPESLRYSILHRGARPGEIEP